FQKVAPAGLDYAANRYLREAQRHYDVLENHMKGREFIVGNEYTIVDVAAWGWIDKAPFVLGEEGLNLYPNLKRWFDNVNARPAALRAREIGKGISFKTEFDEETRRALFPSNFEQDK
ncbi:glutathione binding-like protein, partial [Vibrio splendidus]